MHQPNEILQSVELHFESCPKGHEMTHRVGAYDADVVGNWLESPAAVFFERNLSVRALLSACENVNSSWQLQADASVSRLKNASGVS